MEFIRLVVRATVPFQQVSYISRLYPAATLGKFSNRPDEVIELVGARISVPERSK